MIENVLICKDLKDLPRVASLIMEFYSTEPVFAIYGKMGAGKTTLIQALCKCLNVKDVVTSPTFTIVNEYQRSTGEPVFHFDFYRIRSEVEAMDIGYEEYLYSGNHCFIEWPEKIEKLLPDKYVYLAMEEGEDREARRIIHRLISI